MNIVCSFFFFFSSRRRHTRFSRDWSSDVCSSDLGPPFARYRMLTGGRFEVEAGFPVRTAFTAENGVSGSTLPAGKVALGEYKGAYDGVDAAYSALGEWITDHGGIPSGDSWEVYIDSLDTDPADRR